MNKYVVIVLAWLILMTIPNGRAAAENEAPQLYSESAVLMDADTGQVLFEKNMHTQMYPASITKVLTVLLGIEKGQLNDRITMTRQAVFSIPRGASHIALDEGEQITLEQALMAAMLPSANDASNGIAEHISGSVSEFARLMNQRAREAGALNSNFVNPHGLPDKNQVTTAYDMAMITRAAMQDREFREIFGTVHYIIPPTNKQPESRDLWSEHRMLTTNLYYYDGVIGGKTGYTKESQNTLVTAARRGDRELIAVVMKSENFGVYKDTIALFDYGFNEFVETTIPFPSASVVSSGSGQETKAIQNILDHNRDAVIKRLLHRGISQEDVVADCRLAEAAEPNQSCLIISMRIGPNQFMCSDLGSVCLYASPLPGPEHSVALIFLKIIKILAILATGITILLFALRFYFRKRRMKRRRTYRPQGQRYPYD